MKNLSQLILDAIAYSESYPGNPDADTRQAIFLSHLAYLINS